MKRAEKPAVIEKRSFWIKPFTREITPLDWEAGIIAYVQNFGDKIRAGFKNQIYLPENGKHGFYYGMEDYRKFQNILLRRIKEKGPVYLEEETKLCFQSCEEIVGAVKNLQLALGKKSNSKIVQFYQGYLEKFKRYCFYLEMIPAIEDYLEKTVKDLLYETLKDKSKREIDDYFSIILTKIKKVTAEEEEVDKFKLAVSLREGKDIDVKINQHLKKYAWLPFYGLATTKPLKKEDILKDLRKIKNPRQQLTKRLREIKEQERRLKEVKTDLACHDSRRLLKWIKILQDYLYLRTYRTDAYRRMLFHLKAFAEYLAKETNWKYHDIIYLRPCEIVDFLSAQKLPLLRELDKRRKHWAIIVKNGILKFVSNEGQIENIRKSEFVEEVEKAEVIKGNVAQRGKARGIVRLIRIKKDWERMKNGNILVTHMTKPEMILVIRKAAAIVTDEGGITCHAAIVSKEFGIPCIVGTQIATKVLKDGDFVEIDAGAGIIKKLKK